MEWLWQHGGQQPRPSYQKGSRNPLGNNRSQGQRWGWAPDVMRTDLGPVRKGWGASSSTSMFSLLGPQYQAGTCSRRAMRSGVRLPGLNPGSTSFQLCDILTSAWRTQVELEAGIHLPSLPVLLWRNIPPAFLFSSLEQVRLQPWGL